APRPPTLRRASFAAIGVQNTGPEYLCRRACPSAASRSPPRPRGGRRARQLQRESPPSRGRDRALCAPTPGEVTMTSRRTIRAREAQLGFEALTIEGCLLSPEWLSKVAQLAAGSQTEADYRIPKGLNLRDEIGRYWRIAQAHWKDFSAGLASKAEP